MVPTRLRVFVFALVASFSGLAQPIRLHPQNPHCFLYEGKVIALVTSGEHYGSVLNTGFDDRRYLATLQAAGLNYTRVFGGSYREVPAKSFGILRNTLAPSADNFLAPWARSNVPGYAAGGGKFDLSKWNPAFFARYRDFLSEAARRGVMVEVTLFSSHYAAMQWEVSPFHPANNVNGTDRIDWKKLHTLENGNILAFQESYVRKLVREANGFDNVIFEIQNEPWSDRPELVDVINPFLNAKERDGYPNSIEIADKLSTAWQTRVSEWIRSEEAKLPNKHLIAQNYSNFRYPVRELIPNVEIVNFHYAYSQAVTENYGLGKAISYDETGFLGTSDDVYRRQAWNFMLSGGSIFDGLDYSFSPGHEDGSDTEPNGPGGGSPKFRAQLHVLAEFLKSLPLVDMLPDSHTVRHVGGAHARVLSSRSGTFAMYLDGNGPSELTVDLPSGEYSVKWINPETGAATSSRALLVAHGVQTIQTPDFRNGIALLLVKVSNPK